MGRGTVGYLSATFGGPVSLLSRGVLPPSRLTVNDAHQLAALRLEVKRIQVPVSSHRRRTTARPALPPLP